MAAALHFSKYPSQSERCSCSLWIRQVKTPSVLYEEPSVQMSVYLYFYLYYIYYWLLCRLLHFPWAHSLFNAKMKPLYCEHFYICVEGFQPDRGQSDRRVEGNRTWTLIRMLSGGWGIGVFVASKTARQNVLPNRYGENPCLQDAATLSFEHMI